MGDPKPDLEARAAPLRPALAADLHRRVRRLSWGMGLPLLALLVGLAALQYRQQEALVLRALEGRALAERAVLEPLARETHAHVRNLQRTLVHRLEAPAADLPAPGLLQRALRPWPAPSLVPAAAAGHRSDPSPGIPGATAWTLDAAPAALRDSLGQVQVYRADGGAGDERSLQATLGFLEQSRLAHWGQPPFSQSWLSLFDDPLWASYPFTPMVDRLRAAGQPELHGLRQRTEGFARRSQHWLDDNGAQALSWVPPYRDASGPGLQVGLTAPVVAHGTLRGMVGVDIDVAAFQRALTASTAGHPGRWWLFEQRRQSVIADTVAPLPERVELSAGELLNASLASHLPGAGGVAPPQPQQTELEALVAQAVAHAGQVVRGGGQVAVALDVAPSPWVLLVMLPERELLAEVCPRLLPFGLLGTGLLAVILLAQGLMRRELVAPALAVMDYGRALSQDPQAPPPALPPHWAPWISGVTELVSSRSEMARQQHRSEAFKAAVVDNALAAVVITDGHGQVVDWNPAAERIFGRPRSAALGQPVGDLIIPPRLRGDHDAGLRRLREGSAPRITGQRLDMPALRADGSEFPVEMVLARIVVEGEAYYCAFISDMSERERARQQIEHQREALRQSEKLGAMGSLLAGVAHELNNPLAIVMGRASLLEDKLAEPALQADARQIREAANRCGRIVRTFLNMARAKPAQRREVALNELVQGATELLGYTLRSHGIRLELALGANLPALQADADQLGQVVLNLLVNAQHALAGVAGRERLVRLETGMEARRPDREPRVWLRVRDNGPGVPQALRERLFEPFFTTKAEGAGTGLGLSMSRAMVREHGGDLMLEATPEGGGASFRLSLPPSGAQPAAVPAPASAPPAAAADDSPPRLLLVDDEAQLLDLMRDTLEAAGFEVATAECGEVALELLAEARFDAVVSDLHMPDGDGASLWRGVCERQPALAQRMLFITGDTLAPASAEFLRLSACPSLDKPFAPQELVQRVQALLQGNATPPPA